MSSGTRNAWPLSGKIRPIPLQIHTNTQIFSRHTRIRTGSSVNQPDCRRRSRLIFARNASADAPGVPFNLGQCRIERGMRPLRYSGHGFQGMARRIDHELMRGTCCDVPHRAAKQIRQLPDCAFLCGCDDHIHIGPWAPRGGQTTATTDGQTAGFHDHNDQQRQSVTISRLR